MYADTQWLGKRVLATRTRCVHGGGQSAQLIASWELTDEPRGTRRLAASRNSPIMTGGFRSHIPRRRDCRQSRACLHSSAHPCRRWLRRSLPMLAPPHDSQAQSRPPVPRRPSHPPAPPVSAGRLLDIVCLIVVPFSVDPQTAEVQHGLGSLWNPAHPRAFQAVLHQVTASTFNGPRCDRITFR